MTNYLIVSNVKTSQDVADAMSSKGDYNADDETNGSNEEEIIDANKQK